ncbi:protein tyrosine phosphatase [Pseudoalteromonas sp. S4492]|uniref:low molecular weight protein tyrosine phosphatase family protein n=1 Tax=Pseudoalteromonas TaxID=53246 RepID=UPI0007C45C01|nr:MULTISPECIES: hypothetical protein [Pseudoalteromonas]TMO30077.1 protein tyrosine phosphatase [Pseudoalteromonas sp. S4492]
MRWLGYLCSRNQWRSPTAEKVFNQYNGIKARSAGTSPRARHTVTTADINWADIIFVMEHKHKQRLKAQFSRLLQHKPIQVLDIPDEYQYMDEALIETLKQSVDRYFDHTA